MFRGSWGPRQDVLLHNNWCNSELLVDSQFVNLGSHAQNDKLRPLVISKSCLAILVGGWLS